MKKIFKNTKNFLVRGLNGAMWASPPTTQFFRTVGDDARKSPVCKQIFMQ